MTIYNEIHLFIPRFYLMMSISKKLNRTNTLVKPTNKLYAIKSLCKIGQMRKVKFILDRNCLQKIYFSFVRPTLEYSGVIWGNIPEYLSQGNRKYSVRSSTNCDRGGGGGQQNGFQYTSIHINRLLPNIKAQVRPSTCLIL